MELLGVGAAEALVVLVITLIVVGPNRFPEIARQGGRYFRVARRYATEVTADVRGAMNELESEVEEQHQELKAVQDEIAESITSSIDETREELQDVGREGQTALSDSVPSSNELTNESDGPNSLLEPRELPAVDVPDTETTGQRSEVD